MTKGIYFVRRDLRLQMWLRGYAVLIDVFLIQAIISLTGTLFTLPGSNPVNLTSMIFYILVFLVYAILFESSSLRGTPGKWFMRISVTDAKGNRIRPSRALLRNIIKPVTLISVIGFMIIDLNNHRRAFHDFISVTFVIMR